MTTQKPPVTLTAEAAVEFLNKWLKEDPNAVNKLFATRIHCNTQTASHSTIQVRDYAHPSDDVKTPNVGVLGFLNGMFGVTPSGFGYISARRNLNGNIEEFLYDAYDESPEPIAGEEG